MLFTIAGDNKVKVWNFDGDITITINQTLSTTDAGISCPTWSTSLQGLDVSSDRTTLITGGAS
jgi:hypothetical protein